MTIDIIRNNCNIERIPYPHSRKYVERRNARDTDKWLTDTTPPGVSLAMTVAVEALAASYKEGGGGCVESRVFVEYPEFPGGERIKTQTAYYKNIIYFGEELVLPELHIVFKGT